MSDEYLRKLFDLEEKKIQSLYPPQRGTKKYFDVTEKAYKDALQQFYKTIYLRQMVEDFMTDGSLPVEIDDPDKRAMIDRRAASLVTKPPFCMVTVNPRPGVTLEELQKKVAKYLTKKMITDYLYAYEVRNAEGGLHCHIIVKYQAKPYDFKRGTKNTFKTICDSNNSEILNFRWVEEVDLPSKVMYLQGHKQDKKMKGVEETKLYREKNNLQPLYKHPKSSLLGCEDCQIKSD